MSTTPEVTTGTEVPPKDEKVDTYAPPILMLVFGLPVIAVVIWFVLRWVRPPEPIDDEEQR